MKPSEMTDLELVNETNTTYREFFEAPEDSYEERVKDNEFTELLKELYERLDHSMPKGKLSGMVTAIYKTREEAEKGNAKMEKSGWTIKGWTINRDSNDRYFDCYIVIYKIDTNTYEED